MFSSSITALVEIANRQQAQKFERRALGTVTVSQKRICTDAIPAEFFDKVQAPAMPRIYKMATKLNGTFHAPATARNLEQLGRAQAIASIWKYVKQEDGWHYLFCQHNLRNIRVSSTEVQEMVNGSWENHGIVEYHQRPQAIEVTRYENKGAETYYIKGGTYAYREEIKSHGGIWMKYLKCWRVTGTQEAWMTELVAAQDKIVTEWDRVNGAAFFSKYHFVVKILLNFRIKMVAVNDVTEVEQERAFSEGFLKESWHRMYGFDWKDYPQLELVSA